jgi:hypothetical protein
VRRSGRGRGLRGNALSESRHRRRGGLFGVERRQVGRERGPSSLAPGAGTPPMAARRVAPPHAHARAPPSACGPSSEKCRPECASWNCKLSGRGKTPQQGDTLSRSVVRITGDGHVDGAGARVTRMSLPSARTSARRPAQQPDGERPCASRARPCLSESRYRSGARRAEMTAPSCRPTRRALARRLRARVGRGALRRPGCHGHVLVERYFPLAIPS